MRAQNDDNKVTIMTKDEKCAVFVKKDQVCIQAITSAMSLSAESLFGIETNYGEDLAVFTHKSDKMCITTSSNKNLSVVHIKGDKEVLHGIFDRELAAMVFFQPMCNEDISYLSLNRIINSMRYKAPDKKMLVCDEKFNKHLEGYKGASYSFYILIAKTVVEHESAKRDWFNELNTKVKFLLSKFKQELQDNNENKLTPPEAFELFMEVELRLKIILKT